jgi:hypothetical protein
MEMFTTTGVKSLIKSMSSGHPPRGTWDFWEVASAASAPAALKQVIKTITREKTKNL